jgi:hypothetical protein
MTDEEAERQALLEKAIQDSLASYQISPPVPAHVDDVDTDDDENVKLAIQMSKGSQSQLGIDSDNEEEVKLAIQKSKDEARSTKTEEEIVLEYVKKQSLLEAEHKKAVLGKQKEVEAASEADEEALRQAIEESLRVTGGSAGEGSGS